LVDTVICRGVGVPAGIADERAAVGVVAVEFGDPSLEPVQCVLELCRSDPVAVGIPQQSPASGSDHVQVIGPTAATSPFDEKRERGRRLWSGSSGARPRPYARRGTGRGDGMEQAGPSVVAADHA